MKKLRLLLLIGIGMYCFSCEFDEPATPKDLAQESIIPRPVSLTATGSSFKISNETVILIEEENEDLINISQYLIDLLRTPIGMELPAEIGSESAAASQIRFTLIEDEELGPEGYELEINEDLITISANEPAGLFYGVQTLRQLLPPEIESNNPQQGPWEIATGNIRDYPEYEYRGAMLDVARHFFSVADVRRFIDFLVKYKMNVLHLHLSDDQGWRIEIEKWPNLTLKGGSTEVGGGEGGFFSKRDYALIVQYAQEHYVTVVPEIDMPGHTNAALASYPELNCNNQSPDLYTGIEVGFSTLCTDKEVTYEFVRDVIEELAVMTPGPYIHIGGDESNVTPMEDYIPFINRVQEIVESTGKTMIGWDEVAHADLNPGAVAQFWAEAENAKMAIEKGAQIIMSPAKKAYMDMKYDSTTELGLSWAGLIPIDTGYIWDPANYVEGIERENILGIEAPLWTETVTEMDEIEYLVFPRLLGYAEIGWTPVNLRSWDDYQVRLEKQLPRLKVLNIDYYEPPVLN